MKKPIKNESRYSNELAVSSAISVSSFRKYHLKTRADFDGVGVFVSCDPKTRKSPYIHRIEPLSPGKLVGLQKNDYIFEINGVNVVFCDFDFVIDLLKDRISKNDLYIVVCNNKTYKKWMKANSGKKVVA